MQLEPTEIEREIPAQSRQTCQWQARFPANITTHALPLVAEVTWQGRQFGEIAEANISDGSG